MRIIRIAIVTLAVMLPDSALAENQFTTVTASGEDRWGLPVSIAFEVVKELEIDADKQIIIDGRAFGAATEEGVPITIKTPQPSDDNVVESSFVVQGEGASASEFRRFDYTVERDGVKLTRIVLLGKTQDGRPAYASLTDDPGPWLPVIVLLAAQVSYCAVTYVSPYIKECPSGYDISVDGSLTGLKCSFSCK